MTKCVTYDHSHQSHTRPHRTSTPSQHALDDDWIGSRQTEQQVNRRQAGQQAQSRKPRRRVQPGAESREFYDDDTKQPASRCAPGLCGANHTLTIRRDSALWHSSGTSLQLGSAHRRFGGHAPSQLVPCDLHGDLSLGCSNVRSGRVPPPQFVACSPCGPRCPQRRGAWRFRLRAARGAHNVEGHGGFITRLGPTNKQALFLLEPTTVLSRTCKQYPCF